MTESGRTEGAGGQPVEPGPDTMLQPGWGGRPTELSPEGPANWSGDEPTRRGSARRPVGLLLAVVVLIISGVTVANRLGLLPNDKGKVLFGTAAGPDVCSVDNQTASIATTDPLFWAAVLKDQVNGQQDAELHVTKDGGTFYDQSLPADGTAYDCFGNAEAIKDLDPGAYTFQVLREGAIQATGDLTVK